MKSDRDKSMESDWAEEFETEEWVPGGSPLADESPLAFACYCVYRDMGPNRSLRLAGEQKVNGKKRSLAQWGKWSSRFEWKGRVAAWDEHIAQKAATALIEKRKAEVEAFIEADMDFAKTVRAACKARLQADSISIDAKEIRQIAAAYDMAREWLAEVLEVFKEKN